MNIILRYLEKILSKQAVADPLQDDVILLIASAAANYGFPEC